MTACAVDPLLVVGLCSFGLASRLALAARYPSPARALARDWLDRYIPQIFLARRLDVHPATLSRFLNAVEGYEPTERRPAMLRVLRAIERVCSRADADLAARRSLIDGVGETD